MLPLFHRVTEIIRGETRERLLPARHAVKTTRTTSCEVFIGNCMLLLVLRGRLFNYLIGEFEDGLRKFHASLLQSRKIYM